MSSLKNKAGVNTITIDFHYSYLKKVRLFENELKKLDSKFDFKLRKKLQNYLIFEFLEKKNIIIGQRIFQNVSCAFFFFFFCINVENIDLSDTVFILCCQNIQNHSPYPK